MKMIQDDGMRGRRREGGREGGREGLAHYFSQTLNYMFNVIFIPQYIAYLMITPGRRSKFFSMTSNSSEVVSFEVP